MAIVATPPKPSDARALRLTGLSAIAVARWQTPTPHNASDITQLSVASRPASALIDWTNGSKPTGCRAAAKVHPPISKTGAAPDDSDPHHGTEGTTQHLR